MPWIGVGFALMLFSPSRHETGRTKHHFQQEVVNTGPKKAPKEMSQSLLPYSEANPSNFLWSRVYFLLSSVLDPCGHEFLIFFTFTYLSLRKSVPVLIKVTCLISVSLHFFNAAFCRYHNFISAKLKLLTCLAVFPLRLSLALGAQIGCSDLNSGVRTHSCFERLTDFVPRCP